jgi:solute carrier family 9 (sodium/hydrogen exchanger), member 6/7
MSGNFAVSMDALIVFILLLLYTIGGGYMEHKKFKFGHETSIALIVGLLVSAALHFIPSNDKTYDIAFDGTVFFYVCLPPIIFASGFNMRRKRFFDNIGYILLFGVFGTILTFIIFTMLTYGIISTKILYMYSK